MTVRKIRRITFTPTGEIRQAKGESVSTIETVLINALSKTADLVIVGAYTNQHLLRLDASLEYWIMRHNHGLNRVCYDAKWTKKGWQCDCLND